MCAGMGKSISWHMFHGTSTRPEPYKYGKVDIHGTAPSGFTGLITHSRAVCRLTSSSWGWRTSWNGPWSCGLSLSSRSLTMTGVASSPWYVYIFLKHVSMPSFRIHTAVAPIASCYLNVLHPGVFSSCCSFLVSEVWECHAFAVPIHATRCSTQLVSKSVFFLRSVVRADGSSIDPIERLDYDGQTREAWFLKAVWFAEIAPNDG